MKAQARQHEDLNYLVVGLGLTGYSVACYLLGQGYNCRVQDNRDLPPYFERLSEVFAEVRIDRQALDADLTDWADVLVVSPGISVQQAQIRNAAEQGKRIIGDIELFAQAVTGPVVAITGSNGKSTVTTLVGEMFRADGKNVGVGGNLGTPALDLLKLEADCYVLELSSYQLETTDSLQPQVACVLNLSEDHLDRYDSYSDYVAAKLSVYASAQTRVSNADDSDTRFGDGDLQFSLQTPTAAEFHLLQKDETTWLARGNEAWLDVAELKVSGRHNLANCLAAMAIAHAAGVSKSAMVSAMKAFHGIAHRSQWVAEVNGVEWINDSKATNVGAARASIEGRDRPIILIAGGQSKNADMSVLYEVLQQRVKLVLLMGVDADRMQQAWQGATAIERVEDMQAAVEYAFEHAQPGDCVLLAPACASFDMYEKFEARGEDFMQNLRRLING